MHVAFGHRSHFRCLVCIRIVLAQNWRMKLQTLYSVNPFSCPILLCTADRKQIGEYFADLKWASSENRFSWCCCCFCCHRQYCLWMFWFLLDSKISSLHDSCANSTVAIRIVKYITRLSFTGIHGHWNKVGQTGTGLRTYLHSTTTGFRSIRIIESVFKQIWNETT